MKEVEKQVNSSSFSQSIFEKGNMRFLIDFKESAHYNHKQKEKDESDECDDNGCHKEIYIKGVTWKNLVFKVDCPNEDQEVAKEVSSRESPEEHFHEHEGKVFDELKSSATSHLL
jgi:hypothetical protein